MQDITLGDTSVRVNDGSYHVVRFIRTGANATLQIDDFKTQRKNPLGRQLLVFNTQNQLQIGGKWNPGIGVDRPFIGVMAGFVYNGLRPLDQAKETSPFTKIQGKPNCTLTLIQIWILGLYRILSISKFCGFLVF